MKTNLFSIYVGDFVWGVCLAIAIFMIGCDSRPKKSIRPDEPVWGSSTYSLLNFTGCIQEPSGRLHYFDAGSRIYRYDYQRDMKEVQVTLEELNAPIKPAAEKHLPAQND